MYASNDALQGMKIVSPRRLKTEAEQLRIQQPRLRHLAALNQAAIERGWPSYKAYERAWRMHKAGDEGYVVKLSARWFDSTTKTRGSMHARAVLESLGQIFYRWPSAAELVFCVTFASIAATAPT